MHFTVRGITPALVCTVVFGALALSARGQEEVPGLLRVGLVFPPVPHEEEAGDTEGLDAAVLRSARQGMTMALEELQHNASLLGIELEVIDEAAAGPQEVEDAARRLVEQERVFALVGGSDVREAGVLAAVAEESDVVFMNIGASAQSLRHASCSAHMFHVEPSAGMYLDALLGWFIRSGFRDWAFVIEAGNDAGADQYERARWSMEERHFGAREVARLEVEPESDRPVWREAVRQVESSGAQVVLLLLDPVRQLQYLEAHAQMGGSAQVTGFPYPSAQTRDFFLAASRLMSGTETLYRASAWEATLDAYGARELNSRYRARWEAQMEAPAWAAYVALKVLYEAATATRSLAAADLIAHLRSEGVVFDVWKGIGVSFRPWNNQLRQSLYLVEVTPGGGSEEDVALLVGELPALYMPRTDPVERLDQLGDTARRSGCMLAE